MNILKIRNPVQLKFIPHYQTISAILFYITFFVYTTVSLYGDTTLRYDNKPVYRLLIRIGWYCVYLAMFNAIFLADYSIGQWIMLIGIGITLYISAKHASYRWFYQSYILMLSACNVR